VYQEEFYRISKIFTDVGEEKLVIDRGWVKGREHNEMLARQDSPDLGSLMQPGQWEAGGQDIFRSAGGQITLCAV